MKVSSLNGMISESSVCVVLGGVLLVSGECLRFFERIEKLSYNELEVYKKDDLF